MHPRVAIYSSSTTLGIAAMLVVSFSSYPFLNKQSFFQGKGKLGVSQGFLVAAASSLGSCCCMRVQGGFKMLWLHCSLRLLMTVMSSTCFCQKGEGTGCPNDSLLHGLGSYSGNMHFHNKSQRCHQVFPFRLM
jgi:hypothetical protein